jgi:formyltetrahydrofolate-dependent phosphoribosylglycinamide formyltransferase
LKLAVLISGSGTTLQNLIDQIAEGDLDARISVVIASKPGLKGIDRAAAAQLPIIVIDRREFESAAAFSEQIFAAIDQFQVDLVCLAGWLCLLDIPPRYEARVMNIHPSLLPRFGGKGMYGQKVHQAVLDARCDLSGCTVHYVDNQYDNGPIILQRTCPVLPGDTAHSLAERVFEEEKIAYPEAIRLHFAARRSMNKGERRTSNVEHRTSN